MTTKPILAFDLGTSLGWGSITADGLVMSGRIDLKGRGRFEGGGMRYARFRKALLELIDVVKPQYVVFEEVRQHSSTDAAHLYGGFLGHLAEVCETQNPPIPFLGIPVGTIKKRATGKGNAPKEAMVACAKRDFPNQDIISDDQADALWVLMTAKDIL